MLNRLIIEKDMQIFDISCHNFINRKIFNENDIRQFWNTSVCTSETDKIKVDAILVFVNRYARIHMYCVYVRVYRLYCTGKPP